MGWKGGSSQERTASAFLPVLLCQPRSKYLSDMERSSLVTQASVSFASVSWISATPCLWTRLAEDYGRMSELLTV